MTQTQTTTIAGRAADRPILRGRREFAMFGHHVRRNQADDEPDAGGHQDQIVEISQHRNEIGNEIDRGQGIAGDDQRQRFRVPGNARVAARKMKARARRA